jgi:4-amino-4-deoxy-L-arabinose transferase-like glycosyltransferase
LLLVALAACALYVSGLGLTGLVDETPALFAAASRRMAESGDWLIPQVNGLPRYDKPPLIYWLMGALYALPGADRWDPLGSWAARLPSAFATGITMVALADTLLRWPQTSDGATEPGPSERLPQALVAALAFALGPLVLLWGRTEVSDALFTATLAISLVLAWRTYAAEAGPWWPCWVALALAVLSKGPAAWLLFGLSFGLFLVLGASAARLWRRLRPLPGLALSLSLAAPWYGLALWREGQPYWQSFFGYHNLQRYTRVVNNHQQGWWFFLAMLLVASLPFTPLLLLSLRRVLQAARCPLPPARSLGRFCAAWLLAVLLFFSVSATKLPSYWLVATPAAALLVALAATGADRRPASPDRAVKRDRRDLHGAMALSMALLLLLGAGLAAGRLWLPLIDDPSLPGLAETLAAEPWLPLGAAVVLAAALVLAVPPRRRPSWRLLQSQVVLALLVPLLLLPAWRIGDQLRGAPIRSLAATASAQALPGEALAMVGWMKPSLHFYSRRTVLFEGRSPAALVNLADRLASESRPGLEPGPAGRHPTVLLVIDAITADRPHWRDREGRELDRAGPYRLWRLDRGWLEQRARWLRSQGRVPTWRQPRPERF